MTRPRILPFGDGAVLVELATTASVAHARQARALAAAVSALADTGAPLGVPIPGAASVLVPFDPLALDADTATGLLAPLLEPMPVPDRGTKLLRPGAGILTGRLHEIPVRYGGESGPDLEAVAGETGLGVAEVVAIHAGTEYEVLFIGFAPGFAYLGDVAPAIAVPRLATPRTHVPAGSVAIAATMTAVYPQASPGGWRILGRTDVALFDPAASPPARLRPGDRVRFIEA